MNNQDIRETFEKQLKLLSERSEKSVNDRDLVCLTGEMTKIAGLLMQREQVYSATVSFDGEELAHKVIDIINKGMSGGATLMI